MLSSFASRWLRTLPHIHVSEANRQGFLGWWIFAKSIEMECNPVNYLWFCFFFSLSKFLCLRFPHQESGVLFPLQSAPVLFTFYLSSTLSWVKIQGLLEPNLKCCFSYLHNIRTKLWGARIKLASCVLKNVHVRWNWTLADCPRISYIDVKPQSNRTCSLILILSDIFHLLTTVLHI